MKKILKYIVASFLSLVARGVLHRYQPKIVMVTGSVGKTSTKDAVAAVLAKRFFVRKSVRNFNTEFGVPYTILGITEDPIKYPLVWFVVLKNALALLVLPNHYPNMLVLEIGADKPDDITRILNIATPDAVVVTRLPEIPVHVEAYPSPDAVREEEFSPAYVLSPGAPLIICADDAYARDHSVRTSARIISYGKAKEATVQIKESDFYTESGMVLGMCMKVSVGGTDESLAVKGSVGVTQLLPVAAALAAATAFDISISEARKAFEDYEPPPGRGRIFKGIHNSIVIDDSYNSSPAAVEEALSSLKAFPHAKRRIAVLGDMLELGRYSTMEHARMGELAARAADILVAVGIRARAFATTAGKAEILTFDNSMDAASAIAALVKEGDVILVKGSQSIRTERIVERLLANPSDASRLVRQEREWKRKG